MHNLLRPIIFFINTSIIIAYNVESDYLPSTGLRYPLFGLKRD